MLARLKSWIQKRRQLARDVAAFPAARKLKRRLSVIFTTLTGVILATVVVLDGYVLMRRAEEQMESDFWLTINSLASTVLLSNGESIDLSTWERSGGVVAAAAVNYEPIYVETVYYPDLDREALLEEAEGYSVELAMELEYDVWVWDEGENLDVVILSLAQETMDIGWMVEDYGVAAAAEAQSHEGGVAVSAMEAVYTVGMMPQISISDDAGRVYTGVLLNYFVEDNYYSLLVLKDDSLLQLARMSIVVQNGLMLVFGLLLLAIVCRALAALVLRPIVEGMRRQAEFVAAASHELRSPLAVLRASLAAAGVAPDGAQSEKYQTNALHEAERMSRLVDDLLLLAGGDAGNWKLHTQKVELDTLLIEVAEQYRPLARKAGVQLLLELPDEPLGSTEGDADRLHQILAVLLDNALQYAPRKSVLAVRAARKKNRVEIEVADRGPGIPDAEKAQVFERFYRADESRTDKEHFGLGLSVARELALLHGGELAVRDTEGGGATFLLVLPVGAGPG